MLTKPKRTCVQGSFVQVIRIPTMDRQKLVGGDGRMLLRVMDLRLAVQDFARDSPFFTPSTVGDWQGPNELRQMARASVGIPYKRRAFLTG